jgi:hypothetical protein
MASHTPFGCGWPKKGAHGDELSRRLVVDKASAVVASRRARTSSIGARMTPIKTVATPGQAGLPAEFKHINKRRKRNLPGFP